MDNGAAAPALRGCVCEPRPQIWNRIPKKHFPLPKVRENIPPNPNRTQKLMKSVRRGRSGQNFSILPKIRLFRLLKNGFAVFRLFVSFFSVSRPICAQIPPKTRKKLPKAGTKQWASCRTYACASHTPPKPERRSLPANDRGLTKCGLLTLDICGRLRNDWSGVGLSCVTNQSDARSAGISSARHACDRNGVSRMGDSAINASAAFVLH